MPIRSRPSASSSATSVRRSTANRGLFGLLSSALLVVCVVTTSAAQQRALTIDDIYDPATRQDFGGNVARGLTWVNDNEFLWPKRAQGTTPAQLVRVDAATGTSRPLFDAARFEQALTSVAGLSEAERRDIAHRSSYQLNPTNSGTLLEIADDLFYYEFGGDRVTRLTNTAGTEEEATFSPDGRFVAFVRGGNLSTVEIASQIEVALTQDGSTKITNGKLDWVYQEEVYGRGIYQAYWWSPDSSRLAFLRIDGTRVPDITITDHIPYRQALEVIAYPKAGDPNPEAALGIARVTGGPVVWASLDKYTPIEFLLVNVTWTPDAQRVAFSVQDREQTWLDLVSADRQTGATTLLFRETTEAWVSEHGGPVYLKDGSFLWFSERNGWKHVYHYKADGGLARQLTSGKWEARTLHGVDEANGWLYFSGTERSHIGSDVYRVKLDGTGLSRLSQATGTHDAKFNPGLTRYLDTWSSITTPPQVRLHRADGKEERVIDANPVPTLAQFSLVKPEFVQVKTRDGFVMEGVFIKPPAFSTSKRYPVYQHLYGGPHAQTVRDAWMGSTGLYLQLLAQRGIIVWMCDNRSASGKGAESMWPIYKNFGELELRDLEDGVAWLKQQPFVDAARIGLYGWSYGGFMVTNALTHSRSFAMGIAGGSVTDWRDYDSIYTERFMRMPQNNPEGYRKSSPRFAAKDLSGQLLLLHGLIDDNVHVQNTVQLVYELQKAGKSFELMVYPKSRHGVTDPVLVKHLQTTMLDFTLRTLKPEWAVAAPSAGGR